MDVGGNRTDRDGAVSPFTRSGYAPDVLRVTTHDGLLDTKTLGEKCREHGNVKFQFVSVPLNSPCCQIAGQRLWRCSEHTETTTMKEQE